MNIALCVVLLFGVATNALKWSVSSLSNSRAELAAATLGNKALFGGGAGTSISEVDVFQNEDWASADLGYGRTRLTACSHYDNRRALFAGGWGAPVSAGPYYSNMVNIFSYPNIQTWDTATLSVARADLASSCAGFYCVFAGGITPNGVTNAVDIYSLQWTSWDTATLSEPRSNLTSTYVNSLIFFAGGWNGSASSKRVDIFNVGTQTWTTATLSVERDALASTSNKGYAFFGGGRVSQSQYGNGNFPATNIVDIYHAKSNSWTTATLSQPRSRLAATSLKNLVIFAGGMDQSGLPVNTVDILDVDTWQWTTHVLGTPRGKLAATSVGDYALFAGGTEVTGGPSKIVDVYKLSGPTDITLSHQRILENSPVNTELGQLESVDDNDVDTYTYALMNKSGFKLIGDRLYTAVVFDFETQNETQVKVRSIDNEGLFYDKVFTITILNENEVPTDITLSNDTIVDGSPEGTLVGYLHTEDPDHNEAFTYQLKDSTEHFFIGNGNELRMSHRVNRTNNAAFYPKIKSSDSGGKYIEKEFIITVVYDGEPTDIILNNTSIEENLPAGSIVGTLFTIDPDQTDSFNYQFAAGTGGIQFFQINGSTLYTAQSFDYETTPYLTINIRSTDALNYYIEKDFTIVVTDVNEAPTDITLSTTSFIENEKGNIGTLLTIDPDLSTYFEYSVVGGDVNSFWIDGNVLRASDGFDYTQSVHSVRVRSKDEGGLSIEKEFTITFINTAPTSVTMENVTTRILENSLEPVLVGILETVDEDSITFTYTIFPESARQYFAISDSKLLAIAPIDYETQSSFTLEIQSTDIGGLSSPNLMISIEIIDVPEPPTDILLSNSVIESSAPLGTLIGTLSAVDPDSSSFTYYLKSTEDSDKFQIEGNLLKTNGVLSNSTALFVTIGSVDPDQLLFEKTFSIFVLNTSISDATSSSVVMPADLEIVPVNGTSNYTNCALCGSEIYVCSNEESWSGEFNVPLLIPDGYRIGTIGVWTSAMKWCSDNNRVKFQFESEEIGSLENSFDCSCNTCPKMRSLTYKIPSSTYTKAKNFTLRIDPQGSVVCVSKLQLAFQFAGPPMEAIPADAQASGEAPEVLPIVIGSVAGAVVLGILGILVVLFAIKRRNSKGEEHSLELAVMEETALQNVELHEAVGSGHFGKVYRGTWNGTTAVALKSLSNNTVDASATAALLHELKLLKSLNHPNIVRYYGMYQTDDVQYVVMEFMTEGDVSRVLRAGKSRFEMRDLISVSLQAAAGMAYIGSQKVIHRDLAARNLLATYGNGEHTIIVKIADFGLSKLTETGFYQSESKTIPYKWVAPEVIKFGTFSVKSDVWSFGITMWEIFSCGELPYQTMTNNEAVDAVLGGYRLPMPEVCTPEIYNLMKDCWHVDPDSRPTFQAMHSFLEARWKSSKSEPQVPFQDVSPATSFYN